jgi:hypothetical protein
MTIPEVPVAVVETAGPGVCVVLKVAAQRSPPVPSTPSASPPSSVAGPFDFFSLPASSSTFVPCAFAVLPAARAEVPPSLEAITMASSKLLPPATAVEAAGRIALELDAAN